MPYYKEGSTNSETLVNRMRIPEQAGYHEWMRQNYGNSSLNIHTYESGLNVASIGALSLSGGTDPISIQTNDSDDSIHIATSTQTGDVNIGSKTANTSIITLGGTESDLWLGGRFIHFEGLPTVRVISIINVTVQDVTAAQVLSPRATFVTDGNTIFRIRLPTPAILLAALKGEIDGDYFVFSVIAGIGGLPSVTVLPAGAGSVGNMVVPAGSGSLFGVYISNDTYTLYRLA